MPPIIVAFRDADGSWAGENDARFFRTLQVDDYLALIGAAILGRASRDQGHRLAGAGAAQ
jgi:hypothetical protein